MLKHLADLKENGTLSQQWRKLSSYSVCTTEPPGGPGIVSTTYLWTRGGWSVSRSCWKQEVGLNSAGKCSQATKFPLLCLAGRLLSHLTGHWKLLLRGGQAVCLREHEVHLGERNSYWKLRYLWKLRHWMLNMVHHSFPHFALGTLWFWPLYFP